ncbi:MAG: site-specific integrase [Promethearchaeati archaeon SRVP18_Atabeyarchaeia-1]
MELEPILQRWFDALSVRSVGTANNYVLNINYFLRDLNIESAQSLLDKLRSGELDAYAIMNQYVSLLSKEGKAPNTISNNLNALKRFLRFNRVKFDRDMIKDQVITPKLYSVFEDRIPTNEELVTMFNSATQRGRVIIILGIHGLRVGEIGSLKISDLVLDDKIPHLKIRNEVAKEKKGRLVPLTPQAVEVLKSYLVIRHDDSDKLMDITTDRIRKFIMRLLKKCKLDEHTDKGMDKSVKPRTIRRYKLHPHSLRKFFDTYLSVAGVEQSFKAKLMGHKNYLDDSYFRANEEMIAREFEKVIPYLTMGKGIKIEDKRVGQLENQMKEMRKMIETFSEIKIERLQQIYQKILEEEALPEPSNPSKTELVPIKVPGDLIQEKAKGKKSKKPPSP